jgi:hypothetical protein
MKNYFPVKLAIMKKVFFGLTGLFVLASCSSPEIIVNGPTEGQTYVTEGYIWIDVMVSDPDGLKRISYRIYSNAYDFFPAGAPNSYQLNDSQSMQAFEPGHPVEIYFEAEDMNGHIGTKKVTVKHS